MRLMEPGLRDGGGLEEEGLSRKRVRVSLSPVTAADST